MSRLGDIALAKVKLLSLDDLLKQAIDYEGIIDSEGRLEMSSRVRLAAAAMALREVVKRGGFT